MLPNTIACTLTAVPQLSGMSLQAAIGDGALVHPRAEDGADRAPELLVRILREVGLPCSSCDALLVALDELAQSSALKSVSSV